MKDQMARLSDDPGSVTRPSLQKSTIVGTVNVHYDTVGMNAPALLDQYHHRIPGTADAYADSVVAIANQVLAFETQTLGYLFPPSDSADGGGPEYDIYIMDLGLAYYGYTMPQRPLDTKSDGGRYTSYIVIDHDFDFVTPDSNKGLPALRITLAHELFHAIQLGRYGYWYNEIYYYELTATWMEDVVFPEVNDYFVFLPAVQGHFRRPEASFTSNDPGMYSRCTWGHFMAKKFGQRSIRRTFELTRDMRPLIAVDSTLKENASSFGIAFGEWAMWNCHTGNEANTLDYYPEGNRYPEVSRVDIAFVPPLQSMNGELPFLSARYFRVALRDTTLTVLLANTDISAATANSTSPQPYRYQLSTSRLDSTFLSTGSSLFGSLIVSERSNWNLQSCVDINTVSSAPSSILPGEISLSQNYPNPFNPTTSINFFLHEPDFVMLKVYDLAGREVATLVKGHTLSGDHRVEWNAANIASGTYFYRLCAGDQVITRKMLLVR